MNKKVESRKILAILDFFYGFFFGTAIFAAALVFIVTPFFFSAVLFAVSIFALFIFLMIVVKYFRVRIEIAQKSLDIQIESKIFQEQILQMLKHNSQCNSKDCVDNT
ncbi:hypothetical protein [Helicobacter sp. MIT 14-3879]|uniref:hypothetical protein n=1 Tax=Helicobacter sp. MIT 14-3879 TaxID=2040649 RepID=UPI000E1F5832|nr:hypothetical protein [Helicobacter sp. MIT 14-3879]RDU60391.1 hypothetical protein CQA44_10560 [Helicobacter sp. MIT 14-3879]